MSNFEQILVIIPSYRPPKSFPVLVNDLKNLGFKNFLVIDDGSPEEFEHLFSKISDDSVKVIKLEKNMGKGNALKHAVKVSRKYFSKIEYIVFCDDDGQHDSKDVAAVCSFGLNNNAQFVIGSRDLNKMPLKSYIGNVTMRLLLKYLRDLNIPDTQSGLRFMNYNSADMIKDIAYEKFSFELHALLLLKSKNIQIQTVPIKTIYFNNNDSSRFRPLFDSIQVLRSLFSPSKKKDKLE